MKVLLPVDGSPYTKRMLDYVAGHSEMFGAGFEYVFVTVVQPLEPHQTYEMRPEAVEEHYRREVEQALAPVRALVKEHRWNARMLHAIGHPASSIAAIAQQERVDLIVMGSHGHTTQAAALMGSVVTGVLSRCKEPLLVVR